MAGRAPITSLPAPIRRTKGRPTTYNVEQAQEILERLSAGELLFRICEEPGMPSVYAVAHWRDQQPAFGAAFARARAQWAATLTEQAIEISSTIHIGEEHVVEVSEVTNPDGSRYQTRKERRARNDMLGHRRLQAETRIAAAKIAEATVERAYGPNGTSPDGIKSDGTVKVEGGLPDGPTQDDSLSAAEMAELGIDPAELGAERPPAPDPDDPLG